MRCPIPHPLPEVGCLANGAAVKSGARAAPGDILAFMDDDGQHDARDFGELLEKLDHGYEMVIGAIRPFTNGVKFLAIIFKIATSYSPLKDFLPISG
ncbi:MAG: glycosyltransferase, partial [Gammaproteobacteria bacterium]|nr:glycosyltransferase [Gammaproteobacteria bacterium]